MDVPMRNEIRKMLEPVAAQETADAILAKLNSGVMAGFRKPVNISGKKCSSSGGTFEGAGKGKLFLTGEGSIIEVTVDGITLGESSLGGNQYVSPTIEVEFTQSFSVTCKSYGYLVAVFY